MLYKKDVNETRRRELISAAIKVIAENGLENTATNMICAESGINVAYIYRFFESKEDLIAKSFEYVDDEFLGVILENFPVLNCYSIDFEMRCRVLFMKCWNFLMTHKEQTVFYVRYYYSSSFQKYARTEHMQRYKVLLEKMKTAFPESTDVESVMHHILDTLLGEAMKQLNNPRAGNDEIDERNFKLIFSVIRAYIKSEKINSSDVEGDGNEK